MARWFRSHADKLDNPKVQRWLATLPYVDPALFPVETETEEVPRQRKQKAAAAAA